MSNPLLLIVFHCVVDGEADTIIRKLLIMKFLLFELCRYFFLWTFIVQACIYMKSSLVRQCILIKTIRIIRRLRGLVSNFKPVSIRSCIGIILLFKIGLMYCFNRSFGRLVVRGATVKRGLPFIPTKVGLFFCPAQKTTACLHGGQSVLCYAGEASLWWNNRESFNTSQLLVNLVRIERLRS